MKFKRVHSRRETVEHWQRKMEQCLCRGIDYRGRSRHGIVIKVFAARFYDGVRCLVAWDALPHLNRPQYEYRDVFDVDAY